MEIPKVLSKLAHSTASEDPAVQRERFSGNVERPSRAWEHGSKQLNKWNSLAGTMQKVSGHDVKQIKPKEAKQVDNNPLFPQHPPKNKKH